MIAALCRWLLRVSGWTLDDSQRPELARYVLVGYPHTSNWDFVLAMLAKGALGFRFNWVAKHSLFLGPLGPPMRAMGGIPVNRSRPQGFITQLVAEFRRRQRMVVVITPEGTRGWRPYWKSGFYHLARAAEVPLVLGYLDARTRRIGFGPTLNLGEDAEADIARIREFYADKCGIRPQLAGEIRLRPR